MKRKDGLYQKNIYLGTDSTGKKLYRSIYGRSKKEIAGKEQAIRAERSKRYDLTEDDSFSRWADLYLESKRQTATPAELQTADTRAAYLKALIGDRSVRDIRRIDILQIFAALQRENPTTGKPSARRTIERYCQLLSQIFRFAIENRVTEFDPAANAPIPTAPVSERRALTAEERKRIEEFDHPGQLAVMLMLYSGLRRGEAAALLWDDIDLNNHTITVSKSLDYKQNRIKAPKNGKSRVVSIPMVLVRFLSRQPHRSAHVVLSRNGKVMTETAWRALLDTYIKDMNVHYGYNDKASKCKPGGLPLLIEPFTFHCLRHTFCSLMYESGVDVLVAQAQMGHSDVKTTLSIYTHLSEEHRKNDIAKLDDFLSDV